MASQREIIERVHERSVLDQALSSPSAELVTKGIRVASEEKVEELRQQLARIASDDRILVFQSRFVQFWVTKP